MTGGFLLDTNILSEFNKTKPDEGVRQWLSSIPLESLHVSVITLGEIRFGIEKLEPSKRRTQLETWMEEEFASWFRGRILPVNETIVTRWAALAAHRERLGKPLANFDGLIAATALHYGLTLATGDKDFHDLGVTLFNPWEVRSHGLHWPEARETEPSREHDREQEEDLDR